MLRLTQILAPAATRFGDRAAIVDGDRTLSYRELHERCGRAAGMLRRLGCAEGERVCILSLNSHRYVEALFAAAWAGAIAAPLNYRLAATELVQIIKQTEAHVLLVDDEHLELGRELFERSTYLQHLVLMSDAAADHQLIDYEQEIALGQRPQDALRHGDDVAALFFTGGTTGIPKGVMQTHANLVTSALMYVAQWSWREDIVLLSSAPMFHVAAAAVIPPVLLVGGKIIISPRFDPASYLELIERHQVTFANGVPTMLRMVLDAWSTDKRDLSSVRGINYGGAPMPDGLLRSLLDAFPNATFYATYGLTEVTSAATVSSGVSQRNQPPNQADWDTIGNPTPLTEVRVLRPDEQDCEADEVGELVIRGPLVMKGYWGAPEETQEALSGGWFRTGDAGYRDKSGRFFLVDRLKDMIITGGENVYSTEVEAVIREMPQVADVAVVGLPDEKWGEAVHAVVVPNRGSAISEQLVLDHCRSRIAAYKRPRTVQIRAEPLPISGAGKVAKNILRGEAMQRASS